MDSTAKILENILGVLGQIQANMNSGTGSSDFKDTDKSAKAFSIKDTYKTILKIEEDKQSRRSINMITDSLSNYIKVYNSSNGKEAVDGINGYIKTLSDFGNVKLSNSKRFRQFSEGIHAMSQAVVNIVKTSGGSRFLSRGKKNVKLQMDILKEYAKAANDIASIKITGDNFESLIKTSERVTNLINSVGKLNKLKISRKTKRRLNQNINYISSLYDKLKGMVDDGDDVTNIYRAFNALNSTVSIIAKMDGIAQNVNFGTYLYAAIIPINVFIRTLAKSLMYVGKHGDKVISGAEVLNSVAGVVGGITKVMGSVHKDIFLTVASLAGIGILLRKSFGNIMLGLTAISVLGTAVFFINKLFSKFDDTAVINNQTKNMVETTKMIRQMSLLTIVTAGSFVAIGALINNFPDEFGTGVKTIAVLTGATIVITAFATVIGNIKGVKNGVEALRSVTITMGILTGIATLITFAGGYIEANESAYYSGLLAVSALGVAVLGITAIASLIGKRKLDLLAGMAGMITTTLILGGMVFIMDMLIDTTQKMEGKYLAVGLTAATMLGVITLLAVGITGLGTILVAFPLLLGGAAAGMALFGGVLAILYGVIKVADNMVSFADKHPNAEEKIVRSGKIISMAMGTLFTSIKDVTSKIGVIDAGKQAMKMVGVGISSFLAMGITKGMFTILSRYDKLLKQHGSHEKIIASMKHVAGITEVFMESLTEMITRVSKTKGAIGLRKTWSIFTIMSATKDLFKLIEMAGQMKYVTGFDADGKPIYKPFTNAMIRESANNIALTISAFIEELMISLNAIQDVNTKKINKIRKAFTGGWFNDGIMGVVNSSMKAIYKFVNQRQITEDGKVIREGINFDTLINDARAIGMGVSALVSGLVNSMSGIEVKKTDLSNIKRVNTYLNGKNGLFNIANALIKAVKSMDTGVDVLDAEGNIISKASGITMTEFKNRLDYTLETISYAVNKTKTIFKDVKTSSSDAKKLNRIHLFLFGGKSNFLSSRTKGMFEVMNEIVKYSARFKDVNESDLKKSYNNIDILMDTASKILKGANDLPSITNTRGINNLGKNISKIVEGLNTIDTSNLRGITVDTDTLKDALAILNVSGGDELARGLSAINKELIGKRREREEAIRKLNEGLKEVAEQLVSINAIKGGVGSPIAMSDQGGILTGDDLVSAIRSAMQPQTTVATGDAINMTATVDNSQLMTNLLNAINDMNANNNSSKRIIVNIGVDELEGTVFVQ